MRLARGSVGASRAARVGCVGCIAIAIGVSGPVAADEVRKNHFDDPFVQATAAISSCPVPEGPLLTERERRAEAHWRVERGTSCFRSGRCRLPNSYLYDRDIVPRVVRFVRQSGRFDDTSVWIGGQRRWVYLKGCVRNRTQARELERAVRGIDDVEAVVDELSVGADRPRYRVAPSKSP